MVHRRDLGQGRRSLRYVYRAVDQHGQVIDEPLPAAFHNTEQYRNNRVECDHGRLKA